MKHFKTFTICVCIILCTQFAQGQTKQSGEKTVRILTFNILHGATTKGNFDLDKLAQVINNVDPDLVALQEVDYKTKRAKNYDLATELGLRTKMAPLFGKAMNYDGGAYGVGILSKNPIIESVNKILPYTPGREPRTSLSVLVELNSGDTIRFTATHLDHKNDVPDRINQVKTINQNFVRDDYPGILAGDLNDTPGSKAISILEEFWTDSFDDKPEPTYSSDNPLKKIDYIMYQPADRWEVVKNEVICDEVASDHCVVLSVLRLKN